ncbi:MAG: hemolysin activation/secretion protein [Motiliproteus sp.]|jgi:hemolysin activation/secretion protein
MNVSYPRHSYSQLLSGLTLSVFVSAAAIAAPVQPDAGQISQELTKQPVLTQSGTAIPLKIKDAAPDQTGANSDVKINIQAINISGNSVFGNTELTALVADLIGSEHNFSEINAGVARITRFYHDRGYVVARAYLPVQDLKGGVIQISVLEGIIGAQALNNESRLSNARADALLASLHSGQPLQAAPIDRAVLLLSDTPGVGGARASLQPGASVGTSDLLIELDPANAYSGTVELDNYGSYYTGEYRLGAALAINSPLNRGDQLTIRALSSDDNLTYARVAYQLPIGGNGFKLGGAYSDTHYKFMFNAAELSGSASSASLYATYPLIRSQATNLYGTLTLEQKELTDVQVATLDKRVRLGSLGMAGNHQDGLFGGGITSFEGALVTGTLSMDDASLAQDRGAGSANSNGSFSKLNFNLSRLQRLTAKNSILIALSGQYASKNLNSSEKLYLGGANGVRAYPQGEAGGDQGWIVNLEARHQLTEQLQGIAFYDEGLVRINRNVFAAGDNTRHLAGAGIGLNAQYDRMLIKTSVAWRTTGGQPQSEPATHSNDPQLRAQLSTQF